MEIFIEDIPPEGLEVEATEADGWLAAIVGEAANDAYDKGGRARLRASVHRIGGNISVEGELSYAAHPVCDRCLRHYDENPRIPFRTVLAPLYESERQKEREEGLEVELVREDLEFGYYEGDRIDLGEIVREQALLAQPMKHLCREECKGLCQRCGKDLNEGGCGCAEQTIDPRWEALKGIAFPAALKTTGETGAKKGRAATKKKRVPPLPGKKRY